jgi:hypothetical protein
MVKETVNEPDKTSITIDEKDYVHQLVKRRYCNRLMENEMPKENE